MLVKKVQFSPLTDERMRRNEEKCEEKIIDLYHDVFVTYLSFAGLCIWATHTLEEAKSKYKTKFILLNATEKINF